MKKVLSIAIVLSMTISFTGCSKNNDFKNEKKRMIAVLEKCFDAKEMPEETKEIFLKDNMKTQNRYFKDSLYVTVTAKDINSMDFEDTESEMDLYYGVENIFIFKKSEKGASIEVWLTEFEDDENADDAYKQARVFYKQAKIKENDGKLMAKLKLFKSYEYCEVNGKLYLWICFTGTNKDELYDEFCELISEMKYTDMEEFLEEVSNEYEDEEEEDYFQNITQWFS